jgi:hypothetical protein
MEGNWHYTNYGYPILSMKFTKNEDVFMKEIDITSTLAILSYQWNLQRKKIFLWRKIEGKSDNMSDWWSSLSAPSNAEIKNKCRIFYIIFVVARNICCAFLFFYQKWFVFLTSGQDCNSGMQKQIHFRTDMEHYICRPVNNSVPWGTNFVKTSLLFYI